MLNSILYISISILHFILRDALYDAEELRCKIVFHINVYSKG